jgi:hypothetical protein
MPTFLSDPSTAFYTVLGALVIILGLVALRRQKRSDFVNLGIGVVALLVVFLIDRSVESPREEIERRIHEMGAASREGRTADLFQHVSDSFQRKSLDKKGLQELARKAEQMGLGGIEEWDVKRTDFKEGPDGTTCEQSFRAQLKGHPESQRIVVATFKKDPDGQWRLSSFKTMNPVNAGEEMDVPGL